MMEGGGGGSLEPLLIKVPNDDMEEEVQWEKYDMVVVVVDTVTSSL
jgi:hypothetical protein